MSWSKGDKHIHKVTAQKRNTAEESVASDLADRLSWHNCLWDREPLVAQSSPLSHNWTSKTVSKWIFTQRRNAFAFQSFCLDELSGNGASKKEKTSHHWLLNLKKITFAAGIHLSRSSCPHQGGNWIKFRPTKRPVIIYRRGRGEGGGAEDFCCADGALTWSSLKAYSVVLLYITLYITDILYWNDI